MERGVASVFALTHYILIRSVVIAALITASAVVVHWTQARRDLAKEAEIQTAAWARSFANTISSRYADHLNTAGGLTGDALRTRLETQALNRDFRLITKGLPVLRVRIYHPNGVTAYSSEPSEMGERKAVADPSVFRSVFAQGQDVSEIVFRNDSGAQREFGDVDVVRSIVPILDANGNLRSVYEILMDVSARVAAREADSLRLCLNLVAALAALYISLFLVVRRADCILQARFGEPVPVSAAVEDCVEVRTRAVASPAVEERRTSDQLSLEIKQRQWIEDELRTQNFRFDVALKNMSHGLCMFDDEMKLVLCNASYVKLYNLPYELTRPGTTHSAIIEHRVLSGVLKGERTQAAVQVKLAALHGLKEDAPLVRVDQLSDGRLICVTRRLMAGGGWVAVHQDITERENLHAQLAAANDSKSEFLATMSHEIRTPMDGMLGMMELLAGTLLDEEQRSLLETARDSGDVLLTVVNDVLDYSKIEAGALVVENINFDLAATVQRTLLALSSKASEKGLSFCAELDPRVSPWIVADPTRLRQVLYNLLGNAIKFTQQGGVQLSCKQRDLDDGAIELSFDVRDTGIGMSEVARDTIFHRFRQADHSITRHYGGTGLGLTICKTLVQLMGGQIGCTSSPGHGSTFSFTIRCTRGAAPVAASVEPCALTDTPSRKLCVLVSDNNLVNQRLVSTILTRAGHEAHVVANGLEALEAVQRCTYDVVLMDMQMPVMDGPTATAEIRKLPAPAGRVPIIALTANVMAHHQHQCLASGMNSVLLKPLNASKLLTTIVSLAREPSEWPDCRPAVDASPALDRARLYNLKHRVGDAEFRALMDGVLDQARQSLRDLKEALADNDLAKARSVGHEVRGFAGNYGVVKLAELAKKLEQENTSLHALRDLVPQIEQETERVVEQIRKLA